MCRAFALLAACRAETTPVRRSASMATYFPEGTSWRVAESIPGLPVGTELQLRGNELISGNRGIAFSSGEVGEQGVPFHIELVADYDLEHFLARRRDATAAAPTVKDLRAGDRSFCERGRFLLNDARVGLFHNQRISYMTALRVAAVLGRTLVLPGFFKFPHPDAYDGIQWVAATRLFNWSTLEGCYSNVIELGDLIQQCGHEVLDKHVTVPFQTMWMRSASKAPWINATRPRLRWQSPEVSGGKVVQLRSRKTLAALPIHLQDPFWHLLRPFLQVGVSDAQTLRTHGLISNVTTLAGPVCFFPNDEVLAEANGIIDKMQQDDISGPTRLLAMHVRLFKRSTTTSGGYIPTELADAQESLCNLGPEEFLLIVSNALMRSFENFWPSHTYAASNEADLTVIAPYLGGFPGPRRNRYTPGHYDAAVTPQECLQALRSVLVDATVCAQALYFIGNACSTMSEYIYQLRLVMGQPINSSLLLAGVQHAHLIDSARRLSQETGPGSWNEVAARVAR